MPKQERPKYTSDEEAEDVYKADKPSLGDRTPVVKEEKEFLVKEIKKASRARQPAPDEEIESIKRVAPEIVGSLFERIRFLEERISDTKAAMEDRKGLHAMMIKDIEEDMSEKKTMESRLTDMDDKRNLKMDISMLRRDKRNELVRFWKDMYELRAELKELMERLEIESKVVRIFRDLDTKGGK
jgi:hypothetical protein